MPHLCTLLQCALPVLVLTWNGLSAQVHHLRLQVQEGLPASTVVGDLRAALPSGSGVSGFFISESRDSEVFRDLEIDSDSGIISTAASLDRERRDRYEFAAATLTGEVIRVTVVVKDVNDHWPTFPAEAVELNVSESSLPGSRFELPGALDLDEGQFGTQGYRLLTGRAEELFKVELRTGGGSTILNFDLVLMEKLDREGQDLYSLTVEAFDGGVPPKTGHLQVHVNVLDENDNPPVFNQSEYQAVLWENAPLLTPVCQVFAVDPDLGNNGLVTYEINRRQSDPNEFFIVDKNTGVILLNKPLDYETQTFFELVVTAKDHGVQPESSNTFVGIKVLDVNDNSPNINLLFLSESGDPEVSEGAAYGEYVARIAISDPDLGEIKKVSVFLEGGDQKFTLKATDEFLYALCVDGPLDREQKDLYELTVVASDFGSPPLRSERTFLLQVTDVNDNPPSFEQKVYEVSVPEDLPAGGSVLQVKALDRDQDSGIFYSILRSTQDHLLNIHPQSGIISTAAGLDREREADLAFLVVAVDGGFPPLTSTATVNIHVEDINDNKPVFTQQLYNTTIQEHLPNATCFLQVSAEDADGGEYGMVHYSFSDGYNGEDSHPLFHINPVTGDICVSQDIDRDEGLLTFDLLVKAEDQGGLWSQAYLHIDVEDVNDNAPVFNPEKYVTSVSSYTQPGAEILSVIATDRDSGHYGQITYELLPGDSSSLFSVHQSTGTVSLSSPLSALGIGSFRLGVSAQDSSGVAAVRPADIIINVLHTDYAPALFHQSHYTFSIPEDTPPGTAVGAVQAIKPLNSVEALSYRISSGDPLCLFSVDPRSGVISTSLTLDHESTAYTLLTLQALTGSLPVYSTTQVNITITDTNDNPPVFPKTSDYITISHNTPPGTILFLAHAHDADSGENGRIHYSLRPQSEVFSIHPQLGMLTLNGYISRDANRRYRLSVVAEDEGSPSLSSSLNLVVELDSSNPAEETLAFETLIYQVEIGEGAQRDTRVIQVRAHASKTRRGSDLTPVLKYSLEPLSKPPPFLLHPDTGWLFVAQSLDYESEPSYRFTVRAEAQSAAANLTATATVVVTVQDENDNAPVFSRDRFFFRVPEGPSPHGLIGAVKATDRDSRKNGQLSYILLSDGKHFRINSKTGEIINWVALDREEHSHHTLRVLVTDNGHPRLNASTTVHILVSDINDNPPEFTHLPANKQLNVQVWSGLPEGSVVTSMFAKDRDAGENATVTFSLISGNGHFDIDGESGDIRVTAGFLFNPYTNYTLTVVARDSGPVPLEQTALVHIQVHASPKQNDVLGLRQFTVKENTQLGTVIGSFQVSGSSSTQVRYSVAEGDGSLHFGIDSCSGALYVAQPLDYEATQRYFLIVRAEALPAVNATVPVSVSVEDVNDHSPWFPGKDSIVVIGVEEDVAVGTVVYTFNARDGDGSVRNSAIHYSMTFDPDSSVEEEPPFRIDPDSGSVSTTAELNRERLQSFSFTVTAGDRAENTDAQRFTSITAQVFLLDVNDNTPVFVSTETLQVAENVQVGSLIFHLLATDEDEGENGHVTYSLIGGNKGGHFRLERTGYLYLNSSLNYESQHAFSLTVQASDCGLPSLSSTQTLSVEVLDVNDEVPVFQRRVYLANVSENREPGEPVVRVTAVDLDSEENGMVSYSLLPGSGYEFFTIDSHTGLISTSTQLDREIHQSFTLRVQAEDSGATPLSSTATVLCSVLDENDNAPEFSQPSFYITIPENLHPGAIHTTQASDPDRGVNRTLRYFIQNPDGRFSVDPVSGVVSTLKALDREERCNYTLILTASDQGPSPLTSTTLLSISLSDQNDNSPAFSRKSYRASVSEGLPVGSQILQLIASDPDEGPNGDVTFSLAEDTFGTFSVDPETGVVLLTKPLDRETRSQHTFRAIATDNCSQGPRSSVTIVTVQVEDLNDNPPACFKEPTQIIINTRGNAYPGQPITTVTAYDPDYRENGTVVFGLEEEDELFQVDRLSGEVRLKTTLSGGASGTRMLSVLASDQGTPALTSTCLLLVQLNGEQPLLQFTETVYEMSLPENSKTGSWVGNVVAHDQTAQRSSVRYSIFSGNENGAFSINPSTGDITVRDPALLDFEVERRIHLVLLVENGRQSAYARASVSLQDLNDNAPVFKQSLYRTAVWEGQIHNTYIMQVMAMDYDSGLNGQIEYSIVEGNHNNAFIIDSVRGILATNAVLDREITSSYRLVLEAKDSGSPPLTGSCTVRVQVVDVNDNSPAIPAVEPLVVAENLPAGHMVTQIMANDVDLNSAIIYSLAGHGEEDGSFAIDRYSGVITTTRTLDYEEQVLHTLRIRASDSIHQTEAELTVQVLDVNDNAPIFSLEFYQVSLSELTSADSFVVAVSATDRDSGLNGKISYRLLSSLMKGFYVDAENGSIYTSKPLKYVTSDHHVIRLLVEARDSGDPSLSSITSVDVLVEDCNDHAPFFQNNSYQVSVGEDTPAGSLLLTLQAEDQDYSDQNTHLDYTITAGNEQRRFCVEVVSVPSETLQRTVGYLILCAGLDREITEVYSLTVTVTDRGVPPLNSSATVSVFVLDVNDHEPVFNSSEYHAQASENSLVGTILVLVSAQDLDLGANGTVQYNIISGNSKGLFRLDPQTGSLEVSDTLDYEEDTKHILTVQASDGGVPGDRKVSFAVIFITVLDENDNSPFFMFSTINCSVAENLPAFTPVCMVHAVDQDAGTFGLLTYSILTSCFMDYGSGNPDRKEAFAIDPLTGDIHTRQTFDYERDSEYCFLVEARDKGDQTATVKVQVDIEGMDEFSPVFTQKVYQFALPDNARIGESVGHVMAMDHDGGLDGIVQYSLVNLSPFFNINKTTGSVYISNPVYRRKGSALNEEVEDLSILASSPKLDSRSTACRVIVNISNSAEALTGTSLSVQTVSLSVSLTVFLLLLISFVALVLRYKTKENALKKAASLAANLNHGTGNFGRLGSYPQNGISAINLQDLHAPLDMRAKRDISNPLRSSGSSGRGSAEGETAEDQEIKMINEYQRMKQPAAVMLEPDTGIPIDSDQLSCHSVDAHVVAGANLGAGHMVEMASAESLHTFKEEGGGEGMLPRVVNMREMEEIMRCCMPLPDHQDSIEGSLTNLICPEEQLRGSYSWDHLLNWEPRFQPLASVFTDIGMLPDEEAGDKPAGPAEFHSLLRPPPLITGVAQPGIRAVPPRMPQRIVSLGRKPSYPKYAYSPLARNTGLTPSVMTPSFSPSLSLLTLRTPNASPVVSETGVGSFPKVAPLPGDISVEAEIRV
ncbi:protocadherin-23 [Astyanax mexicanus]|uniref:protocadherin-23 n=1 Tax=Astyanax mexicanus TaxID=7994 RepID=UPI0020CAF0CC|nr:protocadherin-23 [Astyanax mexicanus]